MKDVGSVFDPETWPAAYEGLLVEPLFRPFAEELVNRVSLTPGDSVLDVACGTGIAARIARRALGPAARVAGVDAAAAMLAVARQVDPTIDWREGNAVALPIRPGECFSRVICHQALQFFRDKPAAVREMRRALSPGGLAGVATWRALDDSAFSRDLHRVAERHLGALTDARHSFGDEDALARLLADGGFRDVHVDIVRRAVRGFEGPTYARLNAMAVVAMSPNAKALGEGERAAAVDRIAADSLPVVARFTGADGFEFELASAMAIGRA